MANNIKFSENIQEFGYMFDICGDLIKSESIILEHKIKLDKIIRKHGFCPIFNPIEIREDINFPGVRGVYCIAGKIGKKLAGIIDLIKDESELEKIRKMAEDL